MALSPAQPVMMVLSQIVASINLHDGDECHQGHDPPVLFMAFLMLASLGV